MIDVHPQLLIKQLLEGNPNLTAHHGLILCRILPGSLKAFLRHQLKQGDELIDLTHIHFIKAVFHIKGHPVHRACRGFFLFPSLLSASRRTFVVRGGTLRTEGLLFSGNAFHAGRQLLGNFPCRCFRQLWSLALLLRHHSGFFGRLFQLSILPSLLHIQQERIGGLSIGSIHSLLFLLTEAGFQHTDSFLMGQGIGFGKPLCFAALRIHRDVGILHQLLVGFIHHQLQKGHPLLAHSLRRTLFDTALLDTHIHDIAHQVGQAQIAHSLTEQQYQAQQYHQCEGLQVLRNQFHLVLSFLSHSMGSFLYYLSRPSSQPVNREYSSGHYRPFSAL